MVPDASTYRASVSQPALDPSFPSPGTKHHAKHMEAFAASGGSIGLDMGKPEAHTTTSVDDVVEQTDVNEVLDELCRQLAASRIRLIDFLTDGDKLRSGEISTARFRSALGRSGLTVQEIQVACLIKEFQSSKRGDLIDWRRFLAAVTAGMPFRSVVIVCRKISTCTSTWRRK